MLPDRYQVSPSELEAIILNVKDVRDVAVSSIYSKAEATELPLAFIVPRDLGILSPEGKPQTPTSAMLSLAEQVKTVVEENCVYYKRLRGGIKIVNSIPKSPRYVDIPSEMIVSSFTR